VSSGLSLFGRAVAAVVLMIAFYAGATAVVVGLAWLPLQVPGVHVRLTAICWVPAAVILWSIVPRRDRFVPPGPRMDLEREPRLKRELERIAGATGQDLPRDVYVTYEAVAFVARRGDVMGFFGRPVMVLGLP
jgi:hypothetical protein